MTPTCTLKATSGPVAGTEVDVERELVIGRQDADLTIPDEELSRRHAAVRPAVTGVVVEDLGSLNGTFVDGERISGPVTLTADTTIRVGRSELSLQLAIVVAAGKPEEHAGDPGRTRLAATPIPQPQMTRIRAIPGEQAQASEAAPQAPAPQAPAPIPQPQVTRVRPAVPGVDRAQVQGGPRGDDAAGPPGSHEQPKQPHIFGRLLGCILGRRRRGKRAGG
jgi:pSer/pThr/pTyr-binding forkhead associated (FHA) protein